MEKVRGHEWFARRRSAGSTMVCMCLRWALLSVFYVLLLLSVFFSLASSSGRLSKLCSTRACMVLHFESWGARGARWRAPACIRPGGPRGTRPCQEAAPATWGWGGGADVEVACCWVGWSSVARTLVEEPLLRFKRHPSNHGVPCPGAHFPPFISVARRGERKRFLALFLAAAASSAEQGLNQGVGHDAKPVSHFSHNHLHGRLHSSMLHLKELLRGRHACERIDSLEYHKKRLSEKKRHLEEQQADDKPDSELLLRSALLHDACTYR